MNRNHPVHPEFLEGIHHGDTESTEQSMEILCVLRVSGVQFGS